MKILANTKDMPHEEWLMWRRKGIGGSDAGAICGLNPYRSAIDVWVDKTSCKIKEDTENEAMRVGRDLEDYVARRFCEATGKKVRRRNVMMQHDELPFMLANIDREIVGENALLECKTANAYGKARWLDGKCPDSYEIQCHHYMAVTGAEKVYLACLIMGIDFVVVEIERDEEVIRIIEEREKEFWNKYVLTGVMPPPDGSDAAEDVIKELYASSRPGEVQLPEFQYKLQRIDEIDALVKERLEEKDMIKQEIMMEMGELDTAWVGDRKITWKTSKPRQTVDSARLKKERPEIYEEYSKIGNPSRTFRIW